MSTTKNAARAISLITLLGAPLACGDEEDEGAGSGSLVVSLEAEDGIINGLSAGSETEDIQDGWSVSFDKYIVAIGDIDVHLSTDEEIEAEEETVYLVDLTEVGAAGLQLWNLDGLRAGDWEFNYATHEAGEGAERHESVSEADAALMSQNGWTYLIEGTMTKADGVSCPPAALATPGDKTSDNANAGDDPCYAAPQVMFTIGAEAETEYGPCEIDEVPGFAVTDGGTQTVAASIHGDHIFFNGFPEGDEGGINRYAQWLADSDLDLDGSVTMAELAMIAPDDLAEIDARYQLGGSPITPLDTMETYVRAQLKTQGHFQGEGECPADGVGHSHGDEEGHDDHGHDHEGDEDKEGDHDHDHEGM